MLAAALTLALVANDAPQEDHWPAWRGPFGTGVARSAAPLSWSDEQNVVWKVDIPGRGHSTPVVWGSKLFLTTAVPLEDPPGATEDPPEGGRGRGRGGFRTVPLVRSAFLVMCLDRNTGEVLWERVAKEDTPHEGYHRAYGSHASYSPVTDGERLYASFGSFGIYCYDLDGKLLWEKDLGVRMEMRNQFGEGAAPVLHGDALIQVFDHEGDSVVVALDARNGEERWRTGRDEPSTWSTPLITEVDGEWQIVVAGTTRVRSYDLATGKVLWECAGLGFNVIPAVQRHEGAVLVMSGYRGNNMMAIQLGGEGDLTGTEAILWSTKRGNPYTASSVLHQGLLYTVTDRGQISCWDATTGAENYVEERLPRGSQIKASPVAAGEHLYVPTERGDVHVVKLGFEPEIVATNTLEEQSFIASPVIVEGKLYLRSGTHLFCIADGEEEEGE